MSFSTWSSLWAAFGIGVWGLASACEPLIAAPGDWERLPDGRVIVQVKDVRLALPSEGDETKVIRFTDRLQIKNEMSLADVIQAPEAARQMFASASLINVSLPNRWDGKGLFLGRYSRADLRSFGAGFAIGKGARAACDPWAKTYARLASSLAPGEPHAGSSGWAEFKVGDRPLMMAYVRASSNEGHTFSLGISCDLFKYCGSTKCLGPDLEFSYHFSGNVIALSDWLALDQKVLDLLNYVLIDPVR